MADFINVGFGNMVNGDKIISMVSTDAAPIKRMIQNARDEGKAVDDFQRRVSSNEKSCR